MWQSSLWRSSLSHTHPVSSPERDTAGFLFCGHSPRTFCSRPDLEADVSDSECRRRKDKGRFFSVTDRGASRCSQTAGGLIKDVERRVLVRWRSVLCSRSAVSANRGTHTNKHKDCVSLFICCFISWFQLAKPELAEPLCKSHSYHIYHHISDWILLSIWGASTVGAAK